MKVIGKVDGDSYICQVEFRELEKFMGLYYGKMERPKVGDEVDLGKGYDFHRDTMDALKTTEEFIRSNKAIIDTIFTGISVMVKGDGNS